MHAPLITDPEYRSAGHLALIDFVGEEEDYSHPDQKEACTGSSAFYDPKCISAWAMSRTRRVIDFCFAVVALLITAPIMLLVFILIRCTSRGPALFRQERMGRNGEVFTLYKFRSMRVASHGGSCVTATGDSRITPIGRILRKGKLDELPQFWNIFCGDMSLIGPRPKLPHLEPLYMPFRPGITGAATLAFRYEEQMLGAVPAVHLDAYYDRYIKPRKAEIDWEYMTQASLRSDIRVVWLTMKACVGSEESDWQVNLPRFTAESAD